MVWPTGRDRDGHAPPQPGTAGGGLFDADLAACLERTVEIPISAVLAARGVGGRRRGREVIAIISMGLSALVVACVTVEPGSELDGRSVVEVEASGQSRFMLRPPSSGTRATSTVRSGWRAGTTAGHGQRDA